MAEIKGDKARRILRYYWQSARRYPLSLAIIFIFVPIAVTANAIFAPLVLARVLERLSNQDFVTGQPWQSFAPEIITYAVLVLSTGLVLWRVVDITVWKLEGKVQRDLAQTVFAHLMNQSADFHANHFGGSLVSQNNKLLSSYVRIADTTIFGALPLAVVVIAAAVVLFGQAPLFAVNLVVFASVYVLVSFRVSAPVRRRGSIHAASESKQTGRLADAITNAMAVKSFAADETENKTFRAATERTHGELLKLMKSHQRQMLYFSGMTGLISAGSLIIAIVSVVTFNVRIGVVFLIFNYTANIVTQLFQFSNQALRNYNRAIGDAYDMITILDTPPEVVDPKRPQKSAMTRGLITFNEVSFAHKDADDAIFQNLNLRIKQGEKVGLVGHSGSGKSTLTRLLLRFSDVDSGKIEINGQNIADVTQNDLRRAIAYVPQEPLLFHRSISENIGYGDHSATQQEIEAVAKQAHAAEFIQQLPKKYDTMVGERGVKLSGGQRQRVAIARAMLKNAPVLVLDEATSALDSESEALIQDALWKLMEGRTAIVIAHRLSTIQRMDRIIVLQEGKIAEEGTHKELIGKNGVYASLWRHQSGGFLEEQ